jgi:hypothetical protein
VNLKHRRGELAVADDNCPRRARKANVARHDVCPSFGMNDFIHSATFSR